MASITTNPKSKNNDSKNTETIIVPDDFYCPITGELMNFPVICPEGHSYEEAALKAWHAINPISPLTRNSLDIRRIRPGYGLLPKYFQEVLGMKANCDIEKGTALNWDLIE